MTRDFACGKRAPTAILSWSRGHYRLHVSRYFSSSSSSEFSFPIRVFYPESWSARHFSFGSIHKGSRYQKLRYHAFPRMNKTTGFNIYFVVTWMRWSLERPRNDFRCVSPTQETVQAEVEYHCEDLRISDHTICCRRRCIPYREKEKRREFPRSITM